MTATQEPDRTATVGRFNLQEYFTPTTHRRLRRLPHLIRSALAIVRRAAPRPMLLSTLLQLASGAGVAVQLLVVRALLEELLAGQVTDRFAAVLPHLVALAVLTGLVSFLNVTLDVQQRLLGQLVAMHAAEEVIRTATQVDLVMYEAPGFHDRLQRAQLSAGSRPVQLASGLIGVASALFTMAGIGVALLVIEPLFFVLIVLAFVPAWLATNHASRLVYRYTVEQTERERRRSYLYALLTRKQEAQEIRAFGLGGFLGRRHRELYEGLIDDLRIVLRRRLKVALVGQMTTAALTAVAVGVLVWFVTSRRMSLSDAGSAAGAMILLSGRLRGFAGSAGGLYDGSLYLEDYTSFVAAAPRIEAARSTVAAPAGLEVLEAHDLSFTYPSRDEPALHQASLVVRRGEVVALVGENGSGKTTFAKLLAGLYRPDVGSITWDDADIAGFDPATVRSRVAVVFQDFVRYQLSAYDNIAMGDHLRFDDRTGVERAARAAGVDDAIGRFDRGYETLLGPEYFGGGDLSIGQWQRIALARAFFRDAPIVILDEPTASLDPRAEEALYSSMRELFAGRGVLLISHRFGSVRAADRIYVLREGRVVEAGHHGELMALDGHYAELFRLQAVRYGV